MTMMTSQNEDDKSQRIVLIRTKAKSRSIRKKHRSMLSMSDLVGSYLSPEDNKSTSRSRLSGSNTRRHHPTLELPSNDGYATEEMGVSKSVEFGPKQSLAWRRTTSAEQVPIFPSIIRQAPDRSLPSCPSTILLVAVIILFDHSLRRRNCVRGRSGCACLRRKRCAGVRSGNTPIGILPRRHVRLARRNAVHPLSAKFDA